MTEPVGFLLTLREFAAQHGVTKPTRKVLRGILRNLRAVERERGVVIFETLSKGTRTRQKLRLDALRREGLLPTDAAVLAGQIVDNVEAKFKTLAVGTQDLKRTVHALGARVRALESKVARLEQRLA